MKQTLLFLLLLIPYSIYSQTADRVIGGNASAPTGTCLAGTQYVSVRGDGSGQLWIGGGSPCTWRKSGDVPTYTVATRPTISGSVRHPLIFITDGATAATGCTTGGGSTKVLCIYDGSAWVATAGSGTVTSVSVITANGVSGSVATATTTPAITLTLGAITPSSVFTSGNETVNGLENGCIDAGANDTYACNLSPVLSSYVTGAHYRFKASTANTGAASININSKGALTIKKMTGGVTTDLVTGDINAGQWVDCTYDGTNCQMTSQVGGSAGITNSAPSGTIPVTADAQGNMATSGVTASSGALGGVTTINGVKRYVALLTEVAPATITAGPLVVGMRYTITLFIPGDNFTNVGAASNATGIVFIATGTTPTDYSHSSVLDSDGAPIATVLENTLGGTVVWTRDGAGAYTGTLVAAFPANKTVVLMTSSVPASATIVSGSQHTSDTVEVSTFDVSDLIAEDDRLIGTTIDIRVFP